MNEQKEKGLQLGFTNYVPVGGEQSKESGRQGDVQYTTYWHSEQIRSIYDTATDRQELQWMQPLRADVNYACQAKRAFTFLAYSKFGMIALQQALSLMNIKVPDSLNG